MDMEVELAAGCSANGEADAMKESFKFFKRRKPPPDFSDVVDFDLAGGSQLTASSNGVSRYDLHVQDVSENYKRLGLKHPSKWVAFSLESHPGLIFICNPFTALGQHMWAARCLRDLPAQPHKTNLDAQGLLPTGHNWWKLCQNGRDRRQLRKLRWVTLGFHHDWNAKVYNMCDRSEFPPDVAALSALVARAAGFGHFSAEAAIVNFYHADSTLAPHTDRSEWDMTAPLLSFSFGQSAIFLLGGPERCTRPAAMFVRSGDVVIMAGQTRTSYHAIPRLLTEQNSSARWQDNKRRLSEIGADASGSRPKSARHSSDRSAHGDRSAGGCARSHCMTEGRSERTARCDIVCECDAPCRAHTCDTASELMDSSDAADDGGDAAAVADYLMDSRINVNVRQVLPEGMLFMGTAR